MSDVRLTATNPEDSTVVPVACNERGELLVSKTVIDSVDNDVTINGNVAINPTPGGNGGASWTFNGQTGSFQCTRFDTGLLSHSISDGGKVRHTRLKNDDPYNVELVGGAYAYRQWIDDGSDTYTINWNGQASGNGFLIRLDPNNPAHYSPVRTTETDEEVMEYVGPVLDVQQELEFLRTQLRATMEKLKMTPEGGWEVWDGDSAS